MADSNITKKALAKALKDLMDEKSFSKISIGDICDMCEMNRKSFYYHFKDKYELLNWIFDTECIAVAKYDDYERRVNLMLDFCRYLYENRKFYRNALQVRGQDSFLEHFYEMLEVVVESRLRKVFEGKNVSKRYVEFATDGFVCAVVRWISEKEPISPEKFTHEMFSYIVNTAEMISDAVKTRQDWETLMEFVN